MAKPATPFEEICETTAFTVGGRSFTNRQQAERFVAHKELRKALHRLGTPPVPSLDPIPNLDKPCTGNRIEVFDDRTDHFRRWLVENIHELLPALQLIAQTHPKSVGVPVRE